MYNLEPEPGVTILRRDFLRLSAGALGTLLLGGCAARRPPEPITWREFVDDLLPRAESLMAKKMTEDAYVAAVVEQLRRVDTALVPPVRDLPRHKLFLVTEFRFSEGRGFPYHDHRQYNGVIFSMEGAVRCRNFDIVDGDREGAKGAKVRIRETTSGTLVPGEASTLTTSRDNIHDVRGGAGGGRVLDIFTWMGPNHRSVYLDVDENAYDPQTRVYEASFK
jgi:hypothetical protein